MPQEFIEKLIKSADNGNAEAQADLGYRYFQGLGVVKDERAAVMYYRKAADQGHANAQYNLGVMLANGLGVEKNEKAAVEQFRKAADQGHANAQFNLGVMLAIGLGVEKNEKEVAKLFQLAAAQGHAYAQNNLGFMKEHGLGIAKNKEEALKLYRAAAAQGNRLAQLNVAFILAQERGLHPETVDAVAKIRMNAHQRDEETTRTLRAMGNDKGWEHLKEDNSPIAQFKQVADRELKKQAEKPKAQQEDSKKQKALEQIDTILQGLQEKISTINHAYPAAKKTAATLLTQLKEARTAYATPQDNEVNAQTAFKDACTKAVNEAKPTLENDLSWGDYLMNLLKELYNAVKKVVTLGTATSFFTPVPSKSAELIQDAEKLQQITPLKNG